MNRALIIGINIYPGPDKLYGCVNDATDTRKFLFTHCGFLDVEIHFLTDLDAKKNTIVDQLKWLTKGVQAGDRIFFYFSGHGDQLPIKDPVTGSETVHEILCPVDFDWTPATSLLDVDVRSVFSTVPAGTECLFVADACYSAGLVPLAPLKGKVRTIPPPKEIRKRLDQAKKNSSSYFTEALTGLNLGFMSSCKADELSVEYYFNGRNSGVFTYNFLAKLNQSQGLTDPLVSLIPDISNSMGRQGFTQTPQLKGDSAVKSRPFLSP